MKRKRWCVWYRYPSEPATGWIAGWDDLSKPSAIALAKGKTKASGAECKVLPEGRRPRKVAR